MNRFRQRHPDYGTPAWKSRATNEDSGSHDPELSDAADNISRVAQSHRDTVIKRDAAAKLRRKKGSHRG